MEKRYFWACQNADSKVLMLCFRTEAERAAWIANGINGPAFGLPVIERGIVKGNHPEVRRIKRRMAKGEVITFPVLLD